MLNIYKTDVDGKTKEIQQFQKGCWIHITDPTREALTTVSSQCHIPIEFLDDSLDLEESARVEYDVDTSSTLIINDYPFIDRHNMNFESYITIPVGIILTKDYLITIGKHPIPFVNQLVRRNVPTSMKTRLALEILLAISNQYVEKLRLLNKQRLKTESNLRNSLTNKQLYELMEIEKSLVYFLTSLRANADVITKLFRTNSVKLYEDDKSLLEDVQIENNQAIETSELYTRILNRVTGTYSSLISNGLNKTMKTLTLFTVFLTLPTLVFSFFGMNVQLPISESSPNSYLYIIIIAIIAIVLIGIIFAMRGTFKK